LPGGSATSDNDLLWLYIIDILEVTDIFNIPDLVSASDSPASFKLCVSRKRAKISGIYLAQIPQNTFHLR
jgi:hypothetical protein